MAFSFFEYIIHLSLACPGFLGPHNTLPYRNYECILVSLTFSSVLKDMGGRLWYLKNEGEIA